MRTITLTHEESQDGGPIYDLQPDTRSRALVLADLAQDFAGDLTDPGSLEITLTGGRVAIALTPAGYQRLLRLVGAALDEGKALADRAG